MCCMPTVSFSCLSQRLRKQKLIRNCFSVHQRKKNIFSCIISTWISSNYKDDCTLIRIISNSIIIMLYGCKLSLSFLSFECVCCCFVTDDFELTQCAVCSCAGLLSQLSCSGHAAARMSPALVAQRRSSSTSQKIKVDFDQSTGEHFANTDCAGERMLCK